ncbi:hypothetical protein LUU34_00484700 [Aix galericulata]|nr:hypothetical protein LUU34_00484700 [Aix galericulata]
MHGLRLKRTIWGSVAFRMRSPNFSTFRQAWKGSCNSEPLITILGKSSKRMDDLQEELSGPGIEDENGSVDRFCGQIPFKSLRKQVKVDLQHLQVDIVFHEAHPSIPGPALLVVVAYNVLVVGIWMLCQYNCLACLPRAATLLSVPS